MVPDPVGHAASDATPLWETQRKSHDSPAAGISIIKAFDKTIRYWPIYEISDRYFNYLRFT